MPGMCVPCFGRRGSYSTEAARGVVFLGRPIQRGVAGQDDCGPQARNRLEINRKNTRYSVEPTVRLIEKKKLPGIDSTVFLMQATIL